LIDADVRLLATSSTNIVNAVADKRLDEDLYRYLTAYTIHVPPLRERRNEIPALARHFMHQLAKRYCLSARELSPAILEAWQASNWTGNLRELEDCVKRYLMVGDEELLFNKSRTNLKREEPDAALGMLHAGKKTEASQVSSCATTSESRSLRSLIQSVKSEAEKSAIAAALERTGWNRKAAARLLKVSYRTVLYKIEQYKMSSFNSPIYPGSHGSGNGDSRGHSV
jgi:DNA-binding NtrC family response regulator